MAIALVPAGPDDLEALLGPVARFNAEQGYAFDEPTARGALAELLARPELGRVYRIASDDRPVGYAVLCFGWSLEWGGRDAFLDEIYLEPPARGQGVGRAALDALLETARELGVRAVHLEVEAANEAGQRLYRGAGFVGNERRILTRPLDR
ncbi:MAG: GNAT family N-acetyltransferase [Myxococcota bacterium]